MGRSAHLVPPTTSRANKKEERAFARSSLALTGGKVRDRFGGRLSAGGGDGVPDVRELARRLLAQGGQGHDADDGDEGQEEGVLHQGGATLALQVQAGGDVPDQFHVHVGVPFRVSAPSRGSL